MDSGHSGPKPKKKTKLESFPICFFVDLYINVLFYSFYIITLRYTSFVVLISKATKANKIILLRDHHHP